MPERGDGATHAIHGIGECLGVLQELIGGGLEESEVPLTVVELWVAGFWT